MWWLVFLPRHVTRFLLCTTCGHFLLWPQWRYEVRGGHLVAVWVNFTQTCISPALYSFCSAYNNSANIHRFILRWRNTLCWWEKGVIISADRNNAMCTNSPHFRTSNSLHYLSSYLTATASVLVIVSCYLLNHDSFLSCEWSGKPNTDG